MTFNHILFPTDFSERSHALDRQVEWLATRFNSRVTLLHVFEIPAAWYGSCDASFVNMECFYALRESAEQRLKEYAINVPETRVERVCLMGTPASEIINWVNEQDIDLIVMGTHGYGALQGWILGSVTAKVLHSITRPVWTDSLLHTPRKGAKISKILCAVEIMDEAIPLLHFTNDLAHELGATVELIHSVPEFDTRPNKYFDFDLHRYLMETARVEIAKMQRDAGCDFPVTVSAAGISTALTEAANEQRADLIVIGRGKSQKTWGRFQTHAYEILRYAPCPVLSYSLNQAHISSSCTAEHLSRYVAGEPLPTGSQRH